MKKPYFPLFVDISEKKMVVFGGGKIATRRVDTLLGFTENITVIAPQVTDRIKKLSKEKQIQWILDVYDVKLLKGADFVLAATDDPVCNTRIVADCKAVNIPVNTAHRKELCDFYFPGIIRRENLVSRTIRRCGKSERRQSKYLKNIDSEISNKDVRKLTQFRGKICRFLKIYVVE